MSSYRACRVQEDFDGAVGLIIDKEVDVIFPPDKYPSLIDNKGHKIMLLE